MGCGIPKACHVWHANISSLIWNTNYLIPVFVVTKKYNPLSFKAIPLQCSQCKIYLPQQEFYIKVAAQLITHLPQSQLFLNFQSGPRPAHCAEGIFNRVCNDLLLVLWFLRNFASAWSIAPFDFIDHRGPHNHFHPMCSFWSNLTCLCPPTVSDICISRAFFLLGPPKLILFNI